MPSDYPNAGASTASLPALPADARPWQRRRPTQILCALGLLLPMAAIVLWMQTQQHELTLRGMFLGPMVGGGALIFWILFLHLVVAGDGLQSLGFRRARLAFDIVLGVGLAAAMLGFHFAFAATAARLFPPRPPVPQIMELMRAVAGNPWLLALWLGPTVWIGVALFEEMARVFLLRRLSLAWPGRAQEWGVIVIVSALVGLVHSYQGSAAVFSIGLQSIVLAWVFFRTGRIGALIVGHALYDSTQIVFAVVMIRQMGN
jgi:membrane protease YdiL (CAAX protease family)